MHFTNQSLLLAKKGLGWTSPNPLVGAVLVKNNKIIATGYHQKFGVEHAEVVAIKKAGRKARGSVLYINLEPCCHQGQTPPCTRAIIEAGILEVHFAMLDPNPLVSGKGKKELEKAGIKVFVGEGRAEAKKLNEIFIKYITKKIPFVAVKWAMTLDGKIATATGNSQWITNEKMRERSQLLRQEYQAILVGAKTVLKDNPSLSNRVKIKTLQQYSGQVHQPIKIILDERGVLPVKAKIFETGKVIIATTSKLSAVKKKQYLALGAELIITKHSRAGVDLSELLRQLGKLGIASVLVEGGSRVLTNFFEKSLIDKYYIFLGDKIAGGDRALVPIGGRGVREMNLATPVKMESVENVSGNLMITAYAKK